MLLHISAQEGLLLNLMHAWHPFASTFDWLLGLGGCLVLAGLHLGSSIEVRDWCAARCCVAIAVVLGVVSCCGLGKPLLELGEQGLVLLVQQHRRFAQPLVLLHDVAVLQPHATMYAASYDCKR